MTRFYPILLFALLLMPSAAQALPKTWIGPDGGNWNNVDHWDPSGVPATSDDVFINGFTGTIVMDVNSTLRSLTVFNGSNVTFAGDNTTRYLTLSCITCDSRVELGSSATFEGGYPNQSCDLRIQLGNSFILDGEMTFTGGVSSDFSISSGSVLINGTLTFDGDGSSHLSCNAASVTTVNSGGKIIYKGGGTTVLNNPASLVIGSNGTYEIATNGGEVPDATWHNNSTLKITGMTTNDPYFGNISQLGNLIWQCPSQSVPAVFNIDVSFNRVEIFETGSSEIQVSSINANQTRTWTINGDYTQNGGKVNLSSGNNGIGKIDFKGVNFYAAKTLTESGNAKGIVEFSGAQPQTGYFGSVQNTVDVVINTADKVLMNTPLTINPGATLALTSGKLFTSASNLLTLSASAVVSGGSISSYVVGPLRKVGNTSFRFPIGKSTVFAPLSITAPSAVTDTFTAEYFNTSYLNTDDMESPLVRVSKLEHWQLVRKSGTGPVQVTLNWQDGSASGINDLNSLAVARFNGATWVNTGGTSNGTVLTGNIQSDTTSYFNWFTFGAKDVNSNPLPVELKTFTARTRDTRVELRWTTATEYRNAWFAVERSLDGVSFAEIGRVTGAGTSTDPRHYSFDDLQPARGVNYYRLRQMDFDGQSSFSPVRTATVGTPGTVLLYPSPAQELLHVQWNDPSPEAMDWEILERSGRLVASGRVPAETTAWEIPVGHLPAATYVLQIRTARAVRAEIFAKK